jgi:hypothetical protein
MNIDLYTKSVLTVIALSLGIIAAQHVIPNAFAQSGIQKVVICDSIYTTFCAQVTGNNGALVVKDK